MLGARRMFNNSHDSENPSLFIMTAASEPQSSALEGFLNEARSTTSEHSDCVHHLTLQILHNLQYQHRWTDLKVHTKTLVNAKVFPRPLISGLPPKRLYVHPDEQAEILRAESRRREQRSSLTSEANNEINSLEKPEVEWVLPSHLREKWSLRQFAEIFDSMDENIVSEGKPWEAHKRLVLAILQDDSTVVYYVCLLLLMYFSCIILTIK
jgi:tRNA-splicing endonuclease subunit Sen15